MIINKPIKSLTCCCCGERTKGRQWFNRDNGFGICGSCISKIERKEDAETVKNCYGVRGIHYNIT